MITSDFVEPEHIPAICPVCETPFVLASSVIALTSGYGFDDEWACPDCQDMVYTDRAAKATVQSLPERRIAERSPGSRSNWRDCQ